LKLQFKYKLAASFAVFGLLIVIVFAVQWVYLSQPADIVVVNHYLNQDFFQADFLYGPQAWVPYASELQVMPGLDANGNGNFYVMFVDLNATSNLNATFPCVRVDYSFSGLHGDAAFHVYGYIKDNRGFSWTNRVDGVGASGFYITTPAGSPNVLQDAQPMLGVDHIYVKVSNKEGATFNDFRNNTYFMKFDKDGSGLNSLHFTTDPRNPSGNVTTTNDTSGTFYVNFTGGRVQDDLVLLVAVNGTINHDFKLNLKSSVPG
jgi:hypothetical protein